MITLYNANGIRSTVENLIQTQNGDDSFLQYQFRVRLLYSLF